MAPVLSGFHALSDQLPVKCLRQADDAFKYGNVIRVRVRLSQNPDLFSGF